MAHKQKAKKAVEGAKEEAELDMCARRKSV
jgi:hypothetical protein